MAISVNWVTSVIFVPQSYLTLVSGSVYSLDVDQFRKDLRDLEDDIDGRPWSRTHDHNDEVSLSGVAYARIVTILTPYTVEFEDGQYSVSCLNANHNIADVKVVNQVSLIVNNAAGLVNLPELQLTTYIGKEGVGITVSPATGLDSDSYPSGTRSTPCKTEANIASLEAERGFRNVYVKDALTITADHSGDTNVWFGDNPQTVPITIGDVATYPSKDVTGAKFQDCFIQGELDSVNIIWECIVGSITNANGFIYQSTIVGPLVVSDNVSIERCWIAPTAPGQEFTIDFDGQAKTVIMSQWSAGRVRCSNMVTGSILGISGTGGRVIPDTSNTGGLVVYGGNILVDETFADNLDELRNSSTAGLVEEIHQINGLDPDNPLVVTPTSRTTGSINQTISGDGKTSSTVTTI